MSKPESGYFTVTKGHIPDVAASLPKDPDGLLDDGWKETTDPRPKMRVIPEYSRRKAQDSRSVLIKESRVRMALRGKTTII